MESREDSGKECADCIEAVRIELRLVDADIDEPSVKFWTAAGCKERLHPIDIAYFCERQLLWARFCKKHQLDLEKLNSEQRRGLLEELFSGGSDHHMDVELKKALEKKASEESRKSHSFPP